MSAINRVEVSFPNGKSDLRLPIMPREPESSAEYFVPGVGGPIEFEHLHRYLFATQFCKDRQVLDIACGEGYGSFLLSQIAARVVGMDVSPATIKKAEEVYVARHLSFRVGDCATIPLDDNSVDTIVCFETIEQVTEQEKFLAELKRVLRTDGCVVISAQIRDMPPHEPDSSCGRKLTEPNFTALLQQTFNFFLLGRQKTIAGSAILPSIFEGRGLCIDGREEPTRFVRSSTLQAPSHLVAVASQKPLPNTEWGLFDDAYFWKSLAERDARELRKLEAALDNMRQRNAKIDYLQAVFAEQMQKYVDQIADQRRAIEELTHQNEARKARLGKYRFARQKGRTVVLEDQIATLYSSTSWRITSPFRKLKSMLGSFRRPRSRH